MKLLISAYACEPNRGSEPGVGWEWATRLAARHEVTVITRSNNQVAIANELAAGTATGKPQFIYVDLPDFFLRLKKRGILPVSLYYLLWQLTARIAVHSRMREFDLVHHVTFNGFRFPGAWWKTPIPVVLGPLGGGSIASSSYRSCFGSCFGSRLFSEWLRGLSVRCWRLNPWTLASLLSSDAVLAVGREMAERFAKLGIQADLMLETAVPAALEAEPKNVQACDRKDFLLVGNLEPWKAWQIAFDAFAAAVAGGMNGHRLVVIGTGQQLAEAKTRAVELGLEQDIEFAGLLPREPLWERMRNARGLVFSSVRDTSGNAALEAMAAACPVICFKHQGVAWMTDDNCAIRIDPGEWESSVEGFAKGMIALAGDDVLVETLGKAGRKRAMEEFSWEAKIRKVERIYQRVTGLADSASDEDGDL
jgi:glycosyltransferase involved in cell wall biosynthesis